MRNFVVSKRLFPGTCTSFLRLLPAAVYQWGTLEISSRTGERGRELSLTMFTPFEKKKRSDKITVKHRGRLIIFVVASAAIFLIQI